MTIQIVAEKNSLCDKYKADGPFGGLTAGTPATSGAATNEITGGSPAYNRKAISWGTSSGGAVSGTGCVFDVASGITVTHFLVCASVTPTTADVKDWVAITNQTFSSQGTYTVTPTYTQT